MKKVLIFTTAVLTLSVLAVIARVYLFPVRQLRLPFFLPSPQQQLRAALADQSLVPSGPIVALGSTLTASVSAVTVLFSSDKDFSVQVRALQLVLPRLKMEGRTAKVIDLRFNKAVIQY